MNRKIILIFILLISPWIAEAKYPELTPAIVNKKANEMLQMHASYKVLTPVLMERILQSYIDQLDPNKTYFIESDIHQWLVPSPELLNQTLQAYGKGDFQVFYTINDAMIRAILRRREIEKNIDLNKLPKDVHASEFKKMEWATSVEDLTNRITRIRALQVDTSLKLTDELKDKALQRIAKRQAKYEDDILNPDTNQRKNLILTNVLKATATALDSHTAYFTPEEASQFMISVQQRLLGIGAQLRDDLNGFTVVKIIDGGPAAENKQLKAKDRIIAVNNEPVVGMDIVDAVGLIRGEKGTLVDLTVIRETGEGADMKEEKLTITVPRGEVILKETRYDSQYMAYGDGGIAYLHLYSFYQDSTSSSAQDLEAALKKLKEEHHLKGVVLDLRYNSGGLLSQAVDVAGLFITKGVVVSIKDNTGDIQHLRDVDGNISWDGPLIVLINRSSASASEIVAQTLQDYGRALIVGDDHSYGKGTFQTFTLNSEDENSVNPEGEFKVTRGRYYTVSGKSPQLTGVISDVVVPGGISELDIGEKTAKFPLENDRIKENFDDDLSDIPFAKRSSIKMLYKFDLQAKVSTYVPYLPLLVSNSKERIEANKSYQHFLKRIAATDEEDEEVEQKDELENNDYQLEETYNVMRDLIYLMGLPVKDLKPAKPVLAK